MRIAATLGLLLLAGCGAARQPYAPVDNVRYAAIGQNPFWMLTIGDDRIVLREAGAERDTIWPRALPVVDGNVTLWRLGDGTQTVTIEARQTPGRCALGARSYEDHVRVTIGELMLNGCGGRMIPEGER